MFAVFKRECRTYLQNLYGFAFAALLFCVVNALLLTSIINTRQPRMEYVLYLGCYVLAATIPFLAMRSMAEDRKSGMDGFCRSLPLSAAAVVLGKFFALVAVMAIPVAVLALYPVILGAFTAIPYGCTYLALLCFFLVGVAFASICLFISALTRHPLAAGGIGLLVTALLCALPFAEYILPDGLFLSIVQNISPVYHMEDMAQYGILNLRSLCVLLLYPVLFVFLTLLVSGARRVGNVAVGAALLAVAIAGNVVLQILPFGVTEWNTDRKNLVGIPPKTEAFLDEIQEDVTIYWLCEDDKLENTLLGDWFIRLLSRYEESSEHIRVKKITDSKDIKEWEEFGIYNYDLIISSERRAEYIASGELFGYASTYINQMYNNQEMIFTAEEMGEMMNLLIAQYPSQQAALEASVYIPTCIANATLTAALDYVTVESMPRPYILTGLDTSPIPSGLKEVFEEYDPEDLVELDISRIETIPEDAGCVILYAPVSDLDERSTAMLNAYLSAGGSLVLATAPAIWTDGAPRLQSLLTPYGLTALSGILFESNASYYVNSTDTLVPQVNSQHSMYSIYSEGLAHRMPWSHAIGISSTANATPIFATSSSAVRKPSGGTSETLGQAAQYYPAAHAMRQIDDGTTSQVIWFGSTDAFSNSVASAAAGNYYYLLDAIELLRGEYVSPYTSTEGVYLMADPMEALSTTEKALWVVVSVAVIPVAVLLWGVAVWFGRRRKR